jgi:CRP-like cAMP-binding protein
MFEKFEQYLGKMIPALTREEVNLLRSKCVLKKLRKKQLLLHEGEINRYKIFVLNGLLRNYSLADDGYEYIMRFTDKDGWTTDPESYYNQVPSRFNIDALEPSEVIMWNREDFEALKQSIPVLSTYSEAMITQNAALTQKRVLMNISASAEEKYVDFVNSFPNIINRVPLHMVASYLGVSRETLTRIRQNLALATK